LTVGTKVGATRSEFAVTWTSMTGGEGLSFLVLQSFGCNGPAVCSIPRCSLQRACVERRISRRIGTLIHCNCCQTLLTTFGWSRKRIHARIFPRHYPSAIVQRVSHRVRLLCREFRREWRIGTMEIPASFGSLWFRLLTLRSVFRCWIRFYSRAVGEIVTECACKLPLVVQVLQHNGLEVLLVPGALRSGESTLFRRYVLHCCFRISGSHIGLGSLKPIANCAI
jgi:hypothetical protein